MQAEDRGESARRFKNRVYVLTPFALGLGLAANYLPVDLGNVFNYAFGSDEVGSLDDIPIARYAAGAALMLLGHKLQNMAVDQLHTAWDGDYMATDGLYRYSRNPFYDAERLYMLGAVMLVPSVSVVAAFAALYVGTSVAARGEAVSMRIRHGKEYKEYKKRTPLFLTGF